MGIVDPARSAAHTEAVRPRSFVISASPGGSLGRYFRSVAEALAERGNDVMFLVPPEPPYEPPHLGQPRVAVWPVGRVGSFRFVDRLLASERPDAVVASFGGDLSCLLAAWRRRVPTRVVFHHTPLAQSSMDEPPGSTWKVRLLVVRRRLVYRLATQILCATERVACDLEENWGVRRDRVVIEPYAIPDLETGDVPVVPDRIVCLGRFNVSKGQDVLVAALPRLLEERPGIQVRFVGVGDDLALVQAQADRLGVLGACEFLGSVSNDQRTAELCAAAVAVFPSRDEGFGLVTIEAQAVGTPVVGSDIPAFRVTVEDGVTGVLVPMDDPEALARAIADLLADPERRERMGSAARKRFVELFSTMSRARPIAERYESLR